MKKKVLIVNYEPKSISRLETIISPLDLETRSARNGEEAKEVVNSFNPDLIIIDPMLPKVSGFDLAKSLVETHPSLPIIMITSVYKGMKYKNEAETKYKVKAYIEEPFDDKVLLNAITNIEGFAPVKKEAPKPAAEPKKKASTKQRLDDILEATLAGHIPSGQKVHKPKPVAPKKTQEPQKQVFTASDIFSDVIDDIEKSDESSIAASSDSVNSLVEDQLEKTLSGLSIKKKKTPKPAATPISKPAPEPEKKPVIEKKEVVVEADLPEEKPTPKKKSESGEEKGIEYGSYVLLDKVATGGMAELFKAKRRGVQGFQKIVAIKKILPHLVDNEEFVTMFIDEAKLAAQLNHPNIAQIYDLGKIDKSFYIAMEYVEGHDLRNVFKECKQKDVYMPEPLILFTSLKILSALDYAHRKKGLDMKDLKIVHRDVSPQNILISRDGDVKLVDFGIAKAATKASQTQAGALKGKLLYMSPEQAWGKSIDSRSDLFSLGSVIYEGLTNKKCFLAESEISILEKVRNVSYETVIKINPDISDSTVNIIDKALASDIEERYQSAKKMEDDIKQLLDAAPVSVSERELGVFMDHLYTGNTDEIKKMNDRYTMGSLKSTVVVADIPKEDPVKTKPEKRVEKKKRKDDRESITDSAAQKTKPEDILREETGTVIMPDLQQVEEYEEEAIGKIGSGKGGNKGILFSIVAIIIIAVAVGIWWVKFKKPAQSGPATPAATQTVQKTETQPVVQPPENTTSADTGEQPTENTEVVSEQSEDVPVDVPAETQTEVKTNDSEMLKNLNQEELVDELMKKKIAAQEAAIREQARLDAEKRKKELQQEIERAKAENEKLKESMAKTEEKAQAVEKKKPVEEKPVDTIKKTDAGTQTDTPADKKLESEVTEETPIVEEKKPEVQIREKTEPEAITPTPVAAPKLKQGDLVPLIEGEVQFPKILNRVEPKKTSAARRMKLKGTIIAQVLIDENGDIKDKRILRTLPGNHGLDEEVLDALSKWEFTPAVKNGIRVSVYYTVTFNF